MRVPRKTKKDMKKMGIYQSFRCIVNYTPTTFGKSPIVSVLEKIVNDKIYIKYVL